MSEILNIILEFFAPLSEQFGTGNARADLSFVLVIILLLGGLLLSLVIILGGKSKKKRGMADNSADGFDRYAGLAGKFERLEMNFNNGRTEVLREVELLKARVEKLEALQGGSLPSENVSEQPTPTPTKPETTSSATVVVPAAEMDDVRDELQGMEEFSEEIRRSTPTHVPIPKIDDPSAAEEITAGLVKTRRGIFQRIKEVFSGKQHLDPEMVEELQAFLVSTDLGVKVVKALTDELRDEVSRGEDLSEEKLLARLKEKVKSRLESVSGSVSPLAPERRGDGPLVIMMVGVNGVGKTTTTAKIADRWKKQGAKLLLVAADTFRAAAVEQLKRWGDELDIPVQTGAEDAKPSTVVYEAMERAKTEEFDVILIDTAGRLHTKSNLMQELEGIRNAVERHQVDAPHEVLLVIDGSTGQNAMQQAKEFNQSIPLSGLVVTKLDGTPKGGIVVAVQDELEVPIRFIGIGEAASDLKEFRAGEFAEALFDSSVTEEVSEPSAHGERRRRRREESATLG